MKSSILNKLLRNKNGESDRAQNALQSAPPALSFDELNPLLAKQLSELEAQIGTLAQVQFELAEERQKMRFEMDALKKAVQGSQISEQITDQNAPLEPGSEVDSLNEAP